MDPATRRRLTRRGILAASAAALGVVGVNALRGDAPTAAEPLIPARRRGIMLYSVRDRIAAAPDDSGVPYGFARVLARVAELGYREVEFFGYDQSTEILGRQITPAEIRRILDDNGLAANGAHIRIDPGTFERQLDIAQTLGMPNIGTGRDPTGSPYPADWDAAADVWNELGRRAHTRGLRLYTHNHAGSYAFLLDAGPPDAAGRPTRSSGTRRLEYFFGRADPRYVFFELDVYWAYVARFRYRRYVDAGGVARTGLFDPIQTVAANSRRFPLFHVKDGARDDTRADGHVMTPLGEGDIDFRSFFAAVGDPDFRHPNWEQDTAPGGAADPARSLEFAARSYRAMSGLTA
ncbi:sugar phosphate isomerase/epimerase family protein [Amorphoplanes digitatis]|uniref:Sugar phosphate isomerase/epimerase n=1 Tax=Actinoplanes digitatis TaxID=1868 RepID=A0A7W7HXV0_9ACTN|nr:sugar phosphate isomerase/epimerase [Actinoplanes digitatis]MBB4762693.1 sugar phosphate isomerase/epimerase [Actinoplanes digitatis]GID91811.1 sugar phosphate isomerase [Actinoplanes digitatis]